MSGGFSLVLQRMQDTPGWDPVTHPDHRVSFRCRAHGEDRRRSGSLAAGTDGRALVHCFSGCTIPAIATALNLTVSEFFTGRAAGTQPRDAAPRRIDRVQQGVDWSAVFDELRFACDDHHVDQLAARLGAGVTPEGIAILQVGWGSASHVLKLTGTRMREDGWAMAMRDGDGRVAGINIRTVSGAKITCRGSRLGLFAPPFQVLSQMPGRIAMPEGASDSLALLSHGVPAAGRPSASWRADHISECKLLRHRSVTVLGERDPSGAGERGAKSFARQLAALWNRPIGVRMPPKGCKDVREFLTQNPLGEGLVDELMATHG